MSGALRGCFVFYTHSIRKLLPLPGNGISRVATVEISYSSARRVHVYPSGIDWAALSFRATQALDSADVSTGSNGNPVEMRVSRLMATL